MADYPVKKNQAHTFQIGLPSSVSSGKFQTNPTLAAGDVKISKDGGALANLATLPTVTPSGGKLVQVSLSATEMDADTVAIVFSDAAGDEWHDVIITIHTADVQLGELATQASVDALENISAADVTAAVPTTTEIEAALLNEGDGQQLIDAIVTLINTNLDLPSLELAAIASAVRTELTTELGRIDAAITTRSTFDPASDDVAVVTTVTNMRGTDNAMLAASYTAPANSDITAIKAKTDSLTFTKSNELDANIQSINDVTVTGVGTDADPWGED